MHPPIEAAADNQADRKIKIKEQVVTQAQTPSQSAAKVAIGELQGEDVVTQEPASPEVVSEAPMVEVVVGEIQREDVVTQEPTSPEVVSEEPMVEVAVGEIQRGVTVTQEPASP